MRARSKSGLTSTFDITASTFDRHRALPAGVAEAIRAAIYRSTGKPETARVLDLGAGTGRIGKAFVEAHDSYIAVDVSSSMLREFLAHGDATVAQADGRQLPFRDGAFDLVLLMQVLSGTHNWKELLAEAGRVLAQDGAMVVGHTSNPTDGVDAQMKQRLATILQEMGVATHEPQKARGQAMAWLEARAARHLHVTAASWTAQRTPREFLLRHRTGARFVALPAAVQEEALQKLAAWAEKKFASLDTRFSEEHRFELEIFGFSI